MRKEIIQSVQADKSDIGLIRESVAGDRVSLEALINRHQDWIYNITFKMVMDHDEAADITQEILIKILTSLATYDENRGSFRTWVYRITANHVATMKKSRLERRFTDLDEYVSLIESIPDNRDSSHPDSRMILEDLRIGCMAGMLICLNRIERLVFILGGIFRVTDVVGSEVVGVSRGNFRKLLSRARRKVYSHMNGLCGHVNPNSPCRCSNKMKSFLDSGRIDPGALRYNKPSAMKLRDALELKLDEFRESYYDPFFDIYRNDPFYGPPDITGWLRNTLEHARFRDIFGIH
ncbi:MAG: RNA polymerase sigma factor [Spirochaetes bacterium]|nr:MAG: RNA polymerase sigma factor [Spirochaetota bacterium]